MKNTSTIIASALVFTYLSTAAGQTTQQSAASPDNPGSTIRVPDFQPGLDDLMTLLIQPRHIKLYYAGSENNWELAAFELAELSSAFRRAAQTIPRYQGNDVNVALQSFINPEIQSIDAAIKAGDTKLFVKGYADLTAGCNSCHTYMEHPFLVIKKPDAAAGSAYVDQKLGK